MKRLRSYWKSLERSAKLRLVIFPFIALSGVVFTILGIFISHDWGGLFLNLGTGLVGAVLITLLIDELVGSSERIEQQDKAAEELRQRLIIEVRSTNRDVSLRALEELRQRGWLEDGSLKWSNLSGSNFESLSLVASKLNNVKLKNVNFEKSNLQLTDFEDSIVSECNFTEAILRDVNFTESDLGRSNFSRADMTGANLTGAFFVEANLQGVNLQSAILVLADFSKANLHNAINLQTIQLLQAYCLCSAIMPDGSVYDGRYDLKGDIDSALKEGIDILNEEAMSRFYGITIRTYQDALNWKKRNLNRISEYLKPEEEQIESVAFADKKTVKIEVKKLSKPELWILSLRNNARIDSVTAVVFAKSLENIVDKGGYKIIVNFREAEYVCSGGFRALLAAQRATKRYNRGEVLLCAVPRRIIEALELAGFTELFKTYENLDEAIREQEQKDKDSIAENPK